MAKIDHLRFFLLDTKNNLEMKKNHYQFIVIFFSGSDLNFCAMRKLKLIGSPIMENFSISFHEVGFGELKTVGSVQLTMKIDDDS